MEVEWSQPRRRGHKRAAFVVQSAVKRQKLQFYGKRPRSKIPAILRSFRPEIKTVDVNAAGSPPEFASISTTAANTVVNLCVEGADHYQRVGKKIMMKSLHLTGAVSLHNPGAGGAVVEYLRIMVVYDRQTNGAAFSLANLLETVDQAGNTSSTAWDHLNPVNYERFKVLRDIRLAIPYDGVGGAVYGLQTVTSPQKFNVNEFIKLDGLETHYQSNGGTVADITTGSLHVFTVGSQPAADAYYIFNWTSRLRYFDH